MPDEFHLMPDKFHFMPDKFHLMPDPTFFGLVAVFLKRLLLNERSFSIMPGNNLVGVSGGV
jgi:hypothetical protein